MTATKPLRDLAPGQLFRTRVTELYGIVHYHCLSWCATLVEIERRDTRGTVTRFVRADVPVDVVQESSQMERTR